MFVCLECRNLFEESIEWEETHGLDYGGEKWSGCPCCHGVYVKAHRCDCCGEWIIDNYIKVDDKRFCNNCFLPYDLGDED